MAQYEGQNPSNSIGQSFTPYAPQQPSYQAAVPRAGRLQKRNVRHIYVISVSLALIGLNVLRYFFVNHL